MSFIRPILARVAAAIVTAFGTWAAAAGVDLDPQTLADLESAIVGLLVAVAFTIYAVVHKWVNRWINPSDDATGERT